MSVTLRATFYIDPTRGNQMKSCIDINSLTKKHVAQIGIQNKPTAQALERTILLTRRRSNFFGGFPQEYQYPRSGKNKDKVTPQNSPEVDNASIGDNDGK